MLGELRPEKALLLGSDPNSPVDLKSQHAEEVSVDLLEIGDHIVVRAGSTPPADGTIIEGSATVNESSLTGESIPVLKNPGDPLLTGTMVISGPIVMRVDSLGETTMLQQIVRAVGESQNGKAPVEELADMITAVFVPVIIYLSIIVSAIWLTCALIPNGMPISYLEDGKTGLGDRVFFALGFSISVLAVACPCGIGLAAPAAQAVGAGMAARAGILAQGGGPAFQLATQVDAVVFDKTGTLTQNRPSVVGVQRFREDRWLLSAVRVIEQTSSHPLAGALVRYSEETAVNEKDEKETVVILSIEEVAGKGASGRIKVGSKACSFLLGNQTLMGEITCPVQSQDAVGVWKRQGYSVVYFALSNVEETPPVFSMAAVFAIADPVRPEAKHVIAALECSGKRVFLLSGDNETTAHTIGRELGIEATRIVAGVLPHEKAQFIRDLREKETKQLGWWPWSQNRTRRSVVMFAGDGLNDSAAVASADVGYAIFSRAILKTSSRLPSLAFAHGSQITLTSASFVLLQTNAPLQGVLDLLNLSTKVYRRQKV
jgi:P-type Cu+ transporter